MSQAGSVKEKKKKERKNKRCLWQTVYNPKSEKVGPFYKMQ